MLDGFMSTLAALMGPPDMPKELDILEFCKGSDRSIQATNEALVHHDEIWVDADEDPNDVVFEWDEDHPDHIAYDHFALQPSFHGGRTRTQCWVITSKSVKMTADGGAIMVHKGETHDVEFAE